MLLNKPGDLTMWELEISENCQIKNQQNNIKNLQK